MKTVRVIDVVKNTILFEAEMRSIHDEDGMFKFNLGINDNGNLAIGCNECETDLSISKELYQWKEPKQGLAFLDYIMDNAIEYHVEYVITPESKKKTGIMRHYYPSKQIEQMKKILEESN